jgi:transposase
VAEHAPTPEVISKLREENERLRRELAEQVRKIAEQTRKIAEQTRKIAEQTKEIEDLKRRLGEAQRGSKRQAAPFARRGSGNKRARRKPGRPAGHEPASRPVPEQVDEQAQAPLCGCPHCGGEVTDIEDHEQFVVDIPPVKPHTTRVVTQSGWCGTCRRRVRTTHPSQVSRAGGAAKTALGPRALGMASELKDRLGVPYRKITDFYATYFGLRVTHGALVHASPRLAARGKPTYDALVGIARASSVVHSDETGWRIDTRSAWLWVFATPAVTIYAVRFSRGHGVVLEMLGADFAGTLVSDGLPALDALHKKHGFRRAQCLGHPLRRAVDLLEVQKRGAARFPHQVKNLLKDAIALSGRHGELAPSTMAEYARRIERRADDLLAWTPTDRENAKLAKHLREHRDQLFSCLYDPAIPATNNFAEQEIRGAVVTRKIGGCNRSERHAHAHAQLASVAQTAHRHGLPFSEVVADWMRIRPERSPPLIPTAIGLLMRAADAKRSSDRPS